MLVLRWKWVVLLSCSVEIFSFTCLQAKQWGGWSASTGTFALWTWWCPLEEVRIWDSQVVSIELPFSPEFTLTQTHRIIYSLHPSYIQFELTFFLLPCHKNSKYWLSKFCTVYFTAHYCPLMKQIPYLFSVKFTKRNMM
jgi:hypothetical protein